MNRIASRSAVDRLIALASDDDKPTPAPAPPAPPEIKPEETKNLETVPVVPEPTLQELEQNPMWKSLLQFRVLIPYISRLLDEMHNRVDPSTAATVEIKHSLAELQTVQRELRMASQDQMAQMRRLEDEFKRSREAAERNALDSSELVEDVKSVRMMMRITTGVLGGLALIMIALLVWVLVRMPH
jgi:hypothetical protein